MPKAKFLVLLRNEQRQEAKPAGAKPAGPSPEEMQKMLAGYNAWMEKFKDDILDIGDKLKSEGRVVRASAVADGPFVEAKELVGGFMIIAADDFDRAVELVKACPASQMPGVSLEIRELSGAKM